MSNGKNHVRLLRGKESDASLDFGAQGVFIRWFAQEWVTCSSNYVAFSPQDWMMLMLMLTWQDGLKYAW